MLMNITLEGTKDDRCMVFKGSMTSPFSREIEKQILDNMRQHQHLKVDLSGVRELDLCGIHLLGVLFSYGADAIHVVAASPAVEAVIARLRLSRQGSKRKMSARGTAYAASPGIKPQVNL